MTQTQTLRWWPRRDKYGRSCHDLQRDGRTLGAVVKLPKVYVDTYGADRAYLANDWTLTDRDAAVTYHRTLKAAKAHLETTVK